MRVRGAAVALSALLVACQPAAPVDLRLTDATVVDIETGVVRRDQTIDIIGGRISRVVNDGAAEAPAARVQALGGRFVIPGLWDMHAHALWDDAVATAFLPAFTRSGVTGIRDMGGSLEVLARARAEALPWWPRIVAAGRILDGPAPVDPSISEAVADGPAAREAVARLEAAGVDFIKTYTLLPRGAFFAAAAAARSADLPLAGHLPADVTPLEGAEAGMESIEHLRDELGGLCAGISAAGCDELPARLAALATHLTPTLAILEAKTIPGYVSGSEPDLNALPAVVADYWRGAREAQQARGRAYFEAKATSFAQRLADVRRFHEAGVPMLAGSDAGNPFVWPGDGLHRELELLVEAGLTPRAALYAATLGAARFLGLDDTGAVRPGQRADLVILAADPLADISNVRAVVGVVRAGALSETD